MILDFSKETEVTYNGRRYPFPEGETDTVESLATYINENHAHLLKGYKPVKKQSPEEEVA